MQSGCVATLHTSWTQWKNLFSFEIFGNDGSLVVEGLGGSYGVERLQVARRNPAGGVPEIDAVDYPGPDESWRDEWNDFAAAIRDGSPYWGTPEDGLRVMRALHALYRFVARSRPVPHRIVGRIGRTDGGSARASCRTCKSSATRSEG